MNGVELHMDPDGGNAHLHIGSCIVCGQPAIIMLDPEDMDGVEKFHNGAFAQVAFPHWDADKRELLISGTHAQCWETLKPPDEEDD